MTRTPPALALALLRRFLPREVREPLIGDLLEAFQRNPSSLHFWQETLSALYTLAGHRSRDRFPGGRDLLGNLRSDLRYAARSLRGSPGFTALAVLIMALGIGATTAIFSVVHPVLFRSLPYPDPSRVIMLWERDADGRQSNTSWATFNDLRARAHSLTRVAVMGGWQPTLTGDHEPERLEGQRVSWSYFSLLAVEPALGRSFRPEEDAQSGERVVILSDGLWRRRFNADPSLIGRSIQISGTAFTLVGVMPRGFENVAAPGAQLWTPLRYDASLPYACRTCRHLRMIGRVAPTADLRDADRELQSLSAELVRDHPTEYPAAGLLVVPLQQEITRAARPVLLAVLGAVVLVLLIACANVTHLLLGRAARRGREFAVRAALGAGQGRLIRQLLTESVLLALLGGVSGLLFAWAGLRLVLALAPASLPRLAGIGLDGTVLGFALGLTTLTGILFGLAPALSAARGAVHATLQRAGGRGGSQRHRGRGLLVISEVALAVMLLLGASLLFRSLVRLVSVDPGFMPERLLTMDVQPDGPRYREDAPTWGFYDQVLAAVRSLPGVEGAAFTSLLPMGTNYDAYGVAIEAKPNPNPELNPAALRFAVTPGYLETMRIPVLRGRGLTETDGDTAGPRVVLINQAFAQHMWPGEDPIGQRIRLGDGNWRTIVGVTGDVHHGGLDEAPSDQVYLPERQWLGADSPMTLVVRTRGDPAALTQAVRSAVWSVDKDQPITNVATMETLLAASTAERRFALRLFLAFAGVAMVLAVAGIYGALSSSVTERTRELGIRLALGASPVNVIRMVLRQGGALIGVGLVLGLSGAVMLGRLLRSLLFEVSSHDPIAMALVAVLFLLVGLVAAMLPARRAARVDPVRTLGAE